MKNKPQSEKFKALARKADCEDDDAAFERKLKKIATAHTPKQDGTTPKKRAQKKRA